LDTPFQAEALGELLTILAATDVEELELELDGARLLVRRDPRAEEPAPPGASGDETTTSTEPFIVTAPAVGVFRRSAGGKTEPPVSEGDTVTVGQVVGAVEAMRILNRVQTERSGVVDRLLVQDGQPVEYGQGLLILRPDGIRG